MNKKIILPESIEYIFNIFENAGRKIFIVGGCLRDLILGNQPNDWDLTTDALPDDIINIAEKNNVSWYEIGKIHGTIIFVIDKKSYEITTFREESEYIESRKPKKVRFISSIELDLARRDFTVNAIAYNHQIGIVDLFDGKNDIKNKIIKTVGKPDDRFTEDALRMLRAVRFATKLNFDIEHKTKIALEKNASQIQNISKERISAELEKILLSNKPSNGIRLLVDTGLIDYIIPELRNTVGFNQKTPYHDKDIYEHTLAVLDATKPTLELRMAALLHDIAKPNCFICDENGIGHFYGHDELGAQMARQILSRLKFAEMQINKICILIRYHMIHFNENYTNTAIKRLVEKLKPVKLEELLDLNSADIKGTAYPNRIDSHKIVIDKYYDMLKNNEAFCLRDVNLKGQDLINMGFKQGPQIGKILSEILNLVLEKPELNEYNSLKEIVENKYNKFKS